jgi:hypothetical protein
MAGGGHKGGTASLRGAARRQLDRPLRGCTKADDGGGSGDAALGGGLFGNGTDLYGALAMGQTSTGQRLAGEWEARE